MHNTHCPKKNPATEYHFLLHLHKVVLQLQDWCHRNEGLQAHYTFDQVRNSHISLSRDQYVKTHLALVEIENEGILVKVLAADLRQ